MALTRAHLHTDPSGWYRDASGEYKFCPGCHDDLVALIKRARARKREWRRRGLGIGRRSTTIVPS